MTDCAQCGHELGVGRYCTNCGHPVDAPADTAVAPAAPDEWRTDTAERPTSPAAAPPPPAAPPAPPPAWTPPPAPRFPLFADEVDEPDRPVAPSTHRRRSRLGAGWAALLVVLAMAVALSAWLLLTADDDEPIGASDPTSSAPATSEKPDPTPDKPSSAAPTGLTAESQVTVPEVAAPGKDVSGKPVDYEGTNMLDGVPETCWRMPGDGTGEEIVVTLPTETRLRSVGLINGYAKKGGDVDWYHGNRRIEQVEWVFDDGTTVPQTLGDTPAVQSLDVDVTTTTITLRLVKVTAPGTGSSRRDFTAISDLVFVPR
ncbi:NADase-type glycan-binding domain-containing protein [Nocardioides conyzicola]|uniref:NAD glycohydrolase translocation F5/8 type C domain-containing protein n=1 Tax=Nocardioides conyzicola TaxID=1651781 RepID=A0ABP8Y4G3_9ACTN